jgi:DNA-binding transcriptional LysR family regulator
MTENCAGLPFQCADVDYRKPDLNLLPILIALFDELNVSGAGRRLGMSQPSVSKALRRMRDTFEDPLFVRGPNGLVPTPRAHAIVRAARPHLKHLQEDLLKDEGFDPATNTQAIRLALSDVAEMALFPTIIAHFRKHAPGCPVSAVSAADDNLVIGLESGEVDLAAGYHPALSRRNFRKRLLSRHGFACLLRAGHAIDAKRIRTEDYVAAAHIGIRRGGSSQTVLERFCDKYRLKLTIPVYTSHVLSVPFIVMESNLIATLPYAVVTRFTSLTPAVKGALAPFDLPYELNLHWHRRFDNEPRSQWLREQMAAIFKGHVWLDPPVGPAPFLAS